MNLLEVSKQLCARTLVLAAAAMAAGIITGQYFGVPILIGICLLIGFSLFAFFNSKNNTVKNCRLSLLFLVLLSFLLGLIRIRDTKLLYSDIVFPEKAIKNTYIESMVSDVSLGNDQFIVVLEQNNDDEFIGKIMVYTDTIDDVRSGDIVGVKGSLYSFNKATNFGQFDQRDYYLARGITYKLYADEFHVIKRNKTLKGLLKGTLLSISTQFQKGLEEVFTSKNMGILSAMLVGNRSELDDNTKGLYQRAGIAHILSISGLHITLIGMGLFKLLMLISKRLRFSAVSSLIIIFLYGMLTGFSISTIRACIMLACAFMARVTGKAYDGQSAAGMAALIILCLSPLELFESGFQLSFVAVYGIFAGNEIKKNLKIKNKILAYLFPAMSAQLFTFPLILRNYYSFSPYSILANLILLPFMSIIVISGFLAGILSAAAISVGSGALLMAAKVTAGPAHFLLRGYEETTEFLLELPGSDMITGCPSIGKCLVYYVVLFILVWLSFTIRNNRNRDKIFISKSPGVIAAIYTLTLCLLTAMMTIRISTGSLYTSFIDVGQGLSMYVECDGLSMLFDGGSSNVKNVGKYRIQPYLMWMGISELEYCFISHTDEDHISGIREIINEGRISIKNLVVGKNYDEDEQIISLAREKTINIIKVEASDEINFDNIDAYIKVLSPDTGFIYEDKNQASMVALIRYKDLSVLFTGDSDMYSESEYVRYLDDEEMVNVLQCPHHGSKYSCSELLLRTVNPDITAISCSKTNNYGHPSPETLQRIKETDSDSYVTSEDGMITVKYRSDGKMAVKKFNS